MSSGPTQSPIVATASLRRGQAAALAATVPSRTSEWPPIYLVPERIVVSGHDAVAREQAVAEFPCRQIDAIGDQEVIAGLQDRQQRNRCGGQARWHQRDAGAPRPLEFCERARERLRCGRAAAAIL